MVLVMGVDFFVLVEVLVWVLVGLVEGVFLIGFGGVFILVGLVMDVGGCVVCLCGVGVGCVGFFLDDGKVSVLLFLLMVLVSLWVSVIM